MSFDHPGIFLSDADSGANMPFDGQRSGPTLVHARHAVGLLNWRMIRRSAAIPHYEQRVALLRQLAAEGRKPERLLAEADAAQPLDDLEEERLAVARIARIVRSTASP